MKIGYGFKGFLFGITFVILGLVSYFFAKSIMIYIILCAPIVLGYLGHKYQKLLNNNKFMYKRVEKKLSKELSKSIKKATQLEVIDAMVVTYNHEIRNPLTIAIGNVMSDTSMDEDKKERVIKSLNRITLILKKIEELENCNLDQYAGLDKKIKF